MKSDKQKDKYYINNRNSNKNRPNQPAQKGGDYVRTLKDINLEVKQSKVPGIISKIID